MNELMNYKGVCRTALATPGLLKEVSHTMGEHEAKQFTNKTYIAANLILAANDKGHGKLPDRFP